MQGHGGDQKCRVRDAIDRPHPLAVDDGRGPLLEIGHQQGRRQPNQFPAEKKRLDRAGQRGHDHAQQEHGIEQKEPTIAWLAMQILVGEGPDRSDQRERQNCERHREPIEHEGEMKVEVLRGHDHPIAQLDQHVARAGAQHQHQDGHRHQQSADDGGLGPASGRSLAERPACQRSQSHHAQQHGGSDDGADAQDLEQRVVVHQSISESAALPPSAITEAKPR